MSHIDIEKKDGYTESVRKIYTAKDIQRIIQREGIRNRDGENERKSVSESESETVKNG